MMKIVIIEDELPAFNRLKKMVLETMPEATVLANLDSVQAATEWFSQHECPDLLFMDIHLADGSAFDLLKKVSIHCPIIFTTAYDEYAMEAFRAKTIDYLLKPVKKQELEAALLKLVEFRSLFGSQEQPAEKLAPSYKKRFLIRFGEHIKTIAVMDIAYCYSENKATFARTFDGRNFPMDHNLDTLETMLDPQDFFRINRQYLISLNSIEEMRSYSKARVIIKLNPSVKEQPVVSSERAADFKAWLAGELQ
ncbi:MAG: response regulator transcription factor [Sphingobacteriales bacterium]|nr:MAG: response regulator transcription factor [Sphingobacteriales bacterium]